MNFENKVDSMDEELLVSSLTDQGPTQAVETMEGFLNNQYVEDRAPYLFMVINYFQNTISVMTFVLNSFGPSERGDKILDRSLKTEAVLEALKALAVRDYREHL